MGSVDPQHQPTGNDEGEQPRTEQPTTEQHETPTDPDEAHRQGLAQPGPPTDPQNPTG